MDRRMVGTSKNMTVEVWPFMFVILYGLLVQFSTRYKLPSFRYLAHHLFSKIKLISKSHLQISKREHIKVADLGLASFKNRITETVCGTTLYMAPEVYEGKPYDSQVDMYSFGLMMWEMWFGKRVFSELRSLIPREFFRRIKDENYRPQTPRSDGRFIPNPPPAQWIELMTSCWHTEPCRRRTAKECKKIIKEVKYNM